MWGFLQVPICTSVKSKKWWKENGRWNWCLLLPEHEAMEDSVAHSIRCPLLLRKTRSDIETGLSTVSVFSTHSQVKPRGAWQHLPPSPSRPRTVQKVSGNPRTYGQGEATGLAVRLPKDSAPFILLKDLSRGTFCRLDRWNILLQETEFCIWVPSQSETSSFKCPGNAPTSSALDSVSCGSNAVFLRPDSHKVRKSGTGSGS